MWPCARLAPGWLCVTAVCPLVGQEPPGATAALVLHPPHFSDCAHFIFSLPAGGQGVKPGEASSVSLPPVLFLSAGKRRLPLGRVERADCQHKVGPGRAGALREGAWPWGALQCAWEGWLAEAGRGWWSSFSPRPSPAAEQVAREPDPGPQGRARCGSRPTRASAPAARQEGPFPAVWALHPACRFFAVSTPPPVGCGGRAASLPPLWAQGWSAALPLASGRGCCSPLEIAGSSGT